MVKTNPTGHAILNSIKDKRRTVMDLIKTGKFLAELRRKKNLTQEQLGEILGVTNKTVSRWENGNYLPPVEILQLLSEQYQVSINEMLSGERLSPEAYREKAEENIRTVMSDKFSKKERENYFREKWRKENLFINMLALVISVAAMIVSACMQDGSLMLITINAIVVYILVANNRMMAYIEKHLYGGIKDKEE